LRLLYLASFLLLAAAPLAARSTADAVPSALVDELLAVLPHQEEWTANREPDAAEMVRIGALNPGREDAVRAILADHERCVAPGVQAATRRGLRAVAQNLGSEKLRRLIAFYRSDDFRTMLAIDDRREKGQPVSAGEDRLFEQILTSNPVAIEFVQAIQDSGPAIAQDEALLAEASRCAVALKAAFERAKLRYQ
jgi:hypothetical protein